MKHWPYACEFTMRQERGVGNETNCTVTIITSSSPPCIVAYTDSWMNSLAYKLLPVDCQPYWQHWLSCHLDLQSVWKFPFGPVTPTVRTTLTHHATILHIWHPEPLAISAISPLPLHSEGQINISYTFSFLPHDFSPLPFTDRLYSVMS